ncbi:hypothetical protein Tco_0278232 [Tanacetum coccineum]
MTSITAQQTKLDLELVPKENRLDIGKCNERILRGLKPKEETFQVILDALAFTLCYHAFLITTDVPEVPEMKESKAYKTYLGYATGDVPPKVLMGEWCAMGERRSGFLEKHPSGSGTVAEKPPSVEKITPTVTSEGTGDKPGVPDVTNDDSSRVNLSLGR